MLRKLESDREQHRLNVIQMYCTQLWTERTVYANVVFINTHHFYMLNLGHAGHPFLCIGKLDTSL